MHAKFIVVTCDLIFIVGQQLALSMHAVSMLSIEMHLTHFSISLNDMRADIIDFVSSPPFRCLHILSSVVVVVD